MLAIFSVKLSGPEENIPSVAMIVRTKVVFPVQVLRDVEQLNCPLVASIENMPVNGSELMI